MIKWIKRFMSYSIFLLMNKYKANLYFTVLDATHPSKRMKFYSGGEKKV